LYKHVKWFKFNLCTSILSVPQCSYSAFWRSENAISDHSSTGLIKPVIEIYLCWERNILKDHHFLNVNSDCYSSNKRIPLLMCCISLSNNEILIYVLDSWVFHNVHFRHFGWLKMRSLIIRKRVLLSQSFWIHFCWD